MTERVFHCPLPHPTRPEAVALIKDSSPQFSGLICPLHGLGRMSPDRYCTRCGVVGASWLSGKCDSCYREITAQLEKEQVARYDAEIWNNALSRAREALLLLGYFRDQNPDLAAMPSGYGIDREQAISAIDQLRKETS